MPLYVFKALHGLASEYVSDLISPYQSNRSLYRGVESALEIKFELSWDYYWVLLLQWIIKNENNEQGQIYFALSMKVSKDNIKSKSKSTQKRVFSCIDTRV